MHSQQINQIVWNLKPLFKSDNDPEMLNKRKTLEQKSQQFINKWKNNTEYTKSPIILAKAIKEYDEWLNLYGCSGDEGTYFYLRSSQEKNNPTIKAKENIIDEFGKKIGNNIQFFMLQIAKIPQEKQKEFLEYEGLKNYKHALKRTFAEAKYILSEPEEKILNLKSTPAHENWVRMTSEALAKEERKILLENEKKEIKPFAEITSLMNSKNKKVRDTAAKEFNKIIEKHSDTAEAELNSVLANKKIDDELRKAQRADTLRHISDDIDTEIVDALINAAAQKFDISQKYYALKAKLLNLKKLEYHERNIEYGNIDKKYSYEEAINLVNTVFKSLDGQFSEILMKFTENGQIDAFPRKGKAQGAYCFHNLISQPTYILLNHTEKLNDVLTLAHEAGHGINNELMREKQNAINFGTPLSTAEVASTFMEDFVLQELIKEADDETKLSIMMMKLNEDISTIFRQIACYKFEQELHQNFREKGYLSKKEIGKLFAKHMHAYMGDAVIQSPGSENWWIYWEHIRNFFYNYSYANGLLISKMLQRYVRKDKKFIKKVKEFLSTGLSDSPENIFKKLNIDITNKNFWLNGIEEVEELLNETEKLAKKLKKI